MKASIENSIKNQIENREIKVSEKAWDRLSQMMEEPVAISSPAKANTKKLWIYAAIAASVAIIFGIFFGWNPNSEQAVSGISTSAEIVNHTTDLNNQQKEVHKSKIDLVAKEQVYYVENSVALEVKDLPGKPKNEITPSRNKDNSVENEKQVATLQEVNVPFIEPEAIKEPESVLAVQADPKLEEKKKVNYVDSEMLLYSIENNEAVKQKNSGSRWVIIDFNK